MPVRRVRSWLAPSLLHALVGMAAALTGCGASDLLADAAAGPGSDAGRADGSPVDDASASADVGGEAPPPVPVEFHVPGTQVGDVSAATYMRPNVCADCHGGAGLGDGPYTTWSGSLMASAGRDPLFFAQLATASQDVPGVGTYCLRCHVPMSIPTGHVGWGTERALTDEDRDGVTCHLCHSLVDPLADGTSGPANDTALVSSLADPPKHYGNAAFVLDPKGLRRGPYTDATPPHPATHSGFVKRGDMCGTCHDVGNVRVARLADGTYRYGPAGQPAPNPDPRAQFPLERTYTEWSLSAFANGGVDTAGRFGGDAGTGVVSTCQDCHMPRVTAAGCIFGKQRGDLARHEFAGASAWVLRIIAKQYPSEVDSAALTAGQANAVAMVQRAASLSLSSSGATVRAHVVNHAGHKIPTGHIEGRRIWVGMIFTDASNATLGEAGRWDPSTGDLDVSSTTVFEMQVGLSPAAAKAAGLGAGVTAHMALADLVIKDNRIPPQGFVNAAYDAAGAGAVGATYADGQNWSDVDFDVPAGATHAYATLWYQTVTREYVEGLRSGNHTDDWGTTLYGLWESTDNGPPIAMAKADLSLQ